MSSTADLLDDAKKELEAVNCDLPVLSSACKKDWFYEKVGLEKRPIKRTFSVVFCTYSSLVGRKNAESPYEVESEEEDEESENDTENDSSEEENDYVLASKLPQKRKTTTLTTLKKKIIKKEYSETAEQIIEFIGNDFDGVVSLLFFNASRKCKLYVIAIVFNNYR